MKEIIAKVLQLSDKRITIRAAPVLVLQGRKTVTVIADRHPVFQLVNEPNNQDSPQLLEILLKNAGTDRELSFFCMPSIRS